MTATQKPRHHGHDGSDAQGHDEHGRDRIQRMDAHGGHGTAVITATTPRPQARRPCTTDADATRPRSCTHHPQSRIQKNVPAQYHTTRNTSTEQTFQRCICNKPLGRGGSPGPKSRGRWVSGLKAECDFRGYLEKLGHDATGWNGAVFAVLASGGASWCGIFSCCNRCCTLHIVYNVPWIDVDDGRAQLGSASISGCYHSLRVA